MKAVGWDPNTDPLGNKYGYDYECPHRFCRRANAAILEERAAIVAWLRLSTDGDVAQAADAIERGEHLK